MKRKLVACLACRSEGSRLYGKPLQNLDVKNGITVLDHILNVLKLEDSISGIVLGVSSTPGNEPYHQIAQKHGVMSIPGHPTDVLQRLIDCCQTANGTDIFRITTECPYFYFPMIKTAWQAHQSHGNDVTVIDGLPEGGHFEIYTLESISRSHAHGNARHRSELCSLYIRENRSNFKVESLPIPDELKRMDWRLTIDYPEDLIVCREVYGHFKDKAPHILLQDILNFLDEREDLKKLIAPYVVEELLW